MHTSERDENNCEISFRRTDWNLDFRDILFSFEGKKAKTERSSSIFGIVNSGDKIPFSKNFLQFSAKTFEHINLY